MSKKDYLYSGPPTSVTLDGEDIPLHPGAVVSLPAGDEYVKTLIALGRLEEVPKKGQTGKNKAAVSEEVNNA